MASSPTQPVPLPYSLRVMKTHDLERADALRGLAGWNQTKEDWAAYLRFEPEGCFVAEVEGTVVGTATTLCYGQAVGWIGMVLVDPEQRRHGIGTALLRLSIDYLRKKGIASIKLDATPLGKKVYLNLGFKDEFDLGRFEGSAPLQTEAGELKVEPLAEVDRDEWVEFDRIRFGLERASILTELIGRRPDLCFATRAHGELTGYLIARQGANAIQIGPWIAQDANAAEHLAAAFFRRVPGQFVFMDAPLTNGTAMRLAAVHGFRLQREFCRMYLGEPYTAGDEQQVFSSGGPEKG